MFVQAFVSIESIKIGNIDQGLIFYENQDDKGERHNFDVINHCSK